jgi:predicted nucleic acid-binding Zn ribbon protein
MKDAPLTKCPQCGKKSLKRLMGVGAGLIFKGSGFYETDYKKSPVKKTDGADKPAKPAGGESKPAAVPATATK